MNEKISAWHGQFCAKNRVQKTLGSDGERTSIGGYILKLEVLCLPFYPLRGCYYASPPNLHNTCMQGAHTSVQRALLVQI